MSPARKAAAALDTQCTWEKGQTQYAVALEMQSLARDRLESRTKMLLVFSIVAILGSCQIHWFPLPQALLPLAAAFSGHQLAPGRALTKGPCPLQATTATQQLEQKIANISPWCSLFSG